MRARIPRACGPKVLGYLELLQEAGVEVAPVQEVDLLGRREAFVLAPRVDLARHLGQRARHVIVIDRAPRLRRRADERRIQRGGQPHQGVAHVEEDDLDPPHRASPLNSPARRWP